MNVREHLGGEANNYAQTELSVPAYVASTQNLNYSLRLIPANSESNVLSILNTHKEQMWNSNL